jgi:hypothetical protein
MWSSTVWGLAGFALTCFVARLSMTDAALRMWFGYAAVLLAISSAVVLAWPIVPVWRGVPEAGAAVVVAGTVLGWYGWGRWFGGGFVNVRDAAQMAYEALEGTPIGTYLERLYQEPESRLSHIFHLFEAYGLPLFAASPPSDRLRKIEWVGGNLMLLPDSSDLAFVSTHTKPAYRNASIRQADLRRLIRQCRKTEPRDLR